MRFLPVLLLCCLAARADIVVVGWDPYPQNVGVTSIKVYYGPTVNPATGGGVGSVTVPVAQTSATITNIGIGLTHFQATAFHSSGIESVPSNDITYTNRNFAPTNLKINSSTNQTAAIWVESPGNKIANVEKSADLVNWSPYATLRMFDVDSASKSIYLSSILPANAFYWRVRLTDPGTLTPAPLPSGMNLKPQ